MRNKQLTLGALFSYGAIILNIILTILYTPWMVSKIGQANYGLYTLAISVIGMFMLDFGLSSAVSRFVSKYNAEQSEEKINTFLGAVFKLYIGIDLLLLIALGGIYFFLATIYKSLTAEELEVFRILYAIVAIFNLIAFPMTPLSGILNAYEQFISAKLCDLINKILSVILVITVLLYTTDVRIVVCANAIAGIISIMIKIIAVKIKTPVRIEFRRVDKSVYKEIFSFSIWTTVASIAQRITYNFAPSILAITSGSIAVAIYGPASSIGGYFYTIAAAINGMFLPRISRMITADKETDLQTLMTAVGRYQTAVLGLIIAGFVCVGDDFLYLWMGEEFLRSYPCVILIMLPALLEYSQQIGNTAIVAKNYVKQQAIQLIVISLIGCIVAIAFSAKWGAVGSCAAIFLTGLCNVIGYNHIHEKKLGIKIIRFYSDCYGTMLIPIIATSFLGRWVCSKICNRSVSWLTFKGCLTVVIYFTFLWFFGLRDNERARIKKLLQTVIRRERH